MNVPRPPDSPGTLLARVAQSDRAAFRELYTAAAPKLMGVLVRMLGNRAEAEDALQEVFTRIWLKARSFDPDKGNGMTWAVAIARNHAIDRLRARQSAPRAASAPDPDAPDLLLQLPDPGPGAETRLSARADMQRVVDCFGELDPIRASAVRRAYLLGQSYQSLADRYEVPINTMRSWLRRSLMQLRECLER